MFLNQVEAFINVAKYKSFSLAAKAMFLSQPTISAHIKSLENELNVQLIVRTTKDVELSEAGKDFYSYAIEMLHIKDVAYQKMLEYTQNINGVLKIAASTVPAQYILPEVISGSLKQFPQIRYDIHQMDSEAVVKSVADLDAELGLCGTVIDNYKCKFEPLVQDRLVLVTPNTEQYRSLNNHFPIQMLKDIPFVWREKGSGTALESQAFLNSIGLSIQDLNIVAEMPTTESVKQAVYHGIGAAIISQKAVADYVKFDYLLQFDFDTDLLTRSLYLVYYNNRRFSPIAKQFVNYLHCYYHTNDTEN